VADKKMTQLADPQAAIASYLDDLLHTATEQANQQDTQAVAKPVVAIASQPLPAKPDPAIAAPLVQAVTAPVQAVTAPQRSPIAGPQARPEWAEKPFECLIFTVAGLQLAVPLVLLGGVHRIEDDVRSMPGSPAWYMGIRPSRDKNLRVVDSAEWIMAGRAPANARANYRFVIHLNNSDWGLACDNVAQSFTLSPQQVRWRTSRSQRPWLAGTVIEQMCALLDVQSMANLLVRAEREQHLDLS
jgi:purine-binding chemotaxis protein CheW